MTDPWTDRLSEYLDDEIDPPDRAALEAHLRTCVACGAVLADLRRVVARARTLEPRAPDADLWPGVAAGIGVSPAIRTGRTGRRWSFSLPELAAAGIALVTLSSGAAWMLHPGVPAVAVGVTAPAPDLVVPVALGSAHRVEQSYDAAIGDLARVLHEGRQSLDTTTVRVIERNLSVIDSAIAEARRAVDTDPANAYLTTHLAETMRRKLELLRQATALISTES